VTWFLCCRLKHNDLAVLSRYAPEDATLQQLATSPGDFSAWAAKLQVSLVASAAAVFST
jgi:hypothetical protein